MAALEKKPGKRTPAAPFTTSTLQQEASRRLGFSVKQTMTVAQRLYEAGHISYMRTDSVNLSETALKAAASLITERYGQDYHQRRQYKTKASGAQEAHEAIRPTNFSTERVSSDASQQRLYELIWKRTVASQMAEARLEKTKASISVSSWKESLVAEGEMVTFDGFLKVYGVTTPEEGEERTDDERLLPPLAVGDTVSLRRMLASEVFDRPKPRYTEASLVKALEEMGIGRPSTYAPTISTIQDRGYVEKGDLEGRERTVCRIELAGGEVTERSETERYGADRNKLIPTDTGTHVSDFLVQYFPEVVDYGFTAKVEERFDEIAEGQQPWKRVISDFYGPFHMTVTAAEGISRQEASGARELGTDPGTGKPVIARLGRFGPMVQIGLAEDEEKPRFAGLPKGVRIQDVTLEDALELFKLPRLVGTTPDGDEMWANNGRFGPYIKFGSLYVSISPEDPMTITQERALELVAGKKESEANKYLKIYDGTDLKIVNGRYGPYLTDGKKNAKLPKDTDPTAITLEEAKKLIDAAPAKARRKRIIRK